MYWKLKSESHYLYNCSIFMNFPLFTNVCLLPNQGSLYDAFVLQKTTIKSSSILRGIIIESKITSSIYKWKPWNVDSTVSTLGNWVSFVSFSCVNTWRWLEGSRSMTLSMTNTQKTVRQCRKRQRKEYTSMPYTFFWEATSLLLNISNYFHTESI